MSAVNTDELELALMVARQRVLKIQDQPAPLGCDDRMAGSTICSTSLPIPRLVGAWDRVSGNKGAATAGVDRRTASSIAAGQGVEEFLGGLRSRG